jgi:thioredoxin-dependent peroxiredoxin
MVELRKRKAAAPAPPVPAKKKATTSSKKAAKDKLADPVPEKVEDSVAESKVEESKAVGKDAKAPNGKASASAAPAVGDAIDFEGFGGVVETHDGSKVTLKELVEKSEAGVVLFTYPKANTPGCKFSIISLEPIFATYTESRYYSSLCFP